MNNAFKRCTKDITQKFPMYLLVDLSRRSSKLFNCGKSKDETVWIRLKKVRKGLLTVGTFL